LKFLKEYTIEHFSNEEQLMGEIDFPELAEHRQTHADYVKAVLDIHKCDKLIGECMATRERAV
jgi:hemerythrin